MSELNTERLHLRKFIPTDLEAFYQLNSDLEVIKYIRPGSPFTKAEVETWLKIKIRHWQEHHFGIWVMEYKQDNSIVGFCGLQYLENTSQVEVGYRLAKRYWQQGLATEAAKASIQYGFDIINLNEIVGITHPENLKSQRVLTKIGLSYRKEAYFYNTDVKYFSISRAEYNNSAFYKPNL
ncbi:MAG: GNAT family N-acetyltransferase [Acidobacteriota bacterium]